MKQPPARCGHHPRYRAARSSRRWRHPCPSGSIHAHRRARLGWGTGRRMRGDPLDASSARGLSLRPGPDAGDGRSVLRFEPRPAATDRAPVWSSRSGVPMWCANFPNALSCC